MDLSNLFNFPKIVVQAFALLSAPQVLASASVPGANVPEIHVPSGFKVSIYATATEGARSMALGDDGTVYVGTRDIGKVYAIRDRNGDGTADDVRVLVENIEMPNGVATLKGDLYIADMTGIRRVRAALLKSDKPVAPETIFEGFPAKKRHGWRYLKVGPDGLLYTAIGVPCNICLPEGPYEGRLIRLDPSHPVPEILAEGLRNSVGLEFRSGARDLWLTDNGRDWLGDDIPPDELNHWTGTMVHFGYPVCHGKAVIDPDYGQPGNCRDKRTPEWEFPAHMASLSVHFYRGSMFPDLKDQLLVVQHGSWNRSSPVGYRIASVEFVNGAPSAVHVFADGWLQSDGMVLGRPVDTLELPDGSLLVSDDHADVIYRISKSP